MQPPWVYNMEIDEEPFMHMGLDACQAWRLVDHNGGLAWLLPLLADSIAAFKVSTLLMLAHLGTEPGGLIFTMNSARVCLVSPTCTHKGTAADCYALSAFKQLQTHRTRG